MNSRRISVIVLPVRSLSACMRSYSISGNLKVILFCLVAIAVPLVYSQCISKMYLMYSIWSRFRASKQHLSRQVNQPNPGQNLFAHHTQSEQGLSANMQYHPNSDRRLTTAQPQTICIWQIPFKHNAVNTSHPFLPSRLSPQAQHALKSCSK
jgi:hypothetical protein